MSNISVIIPERAASIGPFMVGRLLPFHQKRAVGPFVFIDHMGPIPLDEHINMDIEPHPHIGLSTLTYLFEGAILHQDSVGSVQEIVPGAVNWMTAGKGVVHSERMPKHIKDHAPGTIMHGLQIWVALPKELEEMEPAFTHIPAEALPEWEENGVNFKLIAGKAFGKESGVPVFSPLYFVEIKNSTSESQQLTIGQDLYGESGLYVLQGSIQAEGHHYGEKQILVAKDSTLCSFEIMSDSTVFIFGGTPFPEERFLMWNFVSSDPQRLELAKKNWIEQNYTAFPRIPTDEETYIPFPEKKGPLKQKF